jgi:molybdenum cofactor biosynthesis protein B
MDVPSQHRAYAPQSLGFAALTISDTRTAADDGGGRAIREAVERAGHRVVEARIVRDAVPEIRAAVRELLALPGVDVVVTTGGTGLSPHDLTLEAVGPLLERQVEGFGELFRMLSYRQVGPAAMLSRATAGVAGGRAVFALPGSPKAVVLAMEELILPEAAHLVAQARR